MPENETARPAGGKASMPENETSESRNPPPRPAGGTPRTMGEAVRRGLAASAAALRDAFRWAPGTTAALLALRAVESLLPAAQVLAVASLVRSAGEGRPLVLPFLFVTFAAGGFVPLRNLTDGVQTRLRLILRSAYRGQILDIATGLDRIRRADADVAGRVRSAREAVPALSRQATSALRVAQAVATSILLGVSLWPIDWVAALCALAALVPPVLAHASVARAESAHRPLWEESARRADYFEEQLQCVRSVAELDSLGATRAFADRAKAKDREALGHRLATWRVRLRAGFLAGLLSTFLAACGLAAIVWHAHATAHDLAGAIAGTVSGLLAARGFGAAFGGFVASAPTVEGYLAVRSDLLPRRRLQRGRLRHGRFGYPGRRPASRGLACSNAYVAYGEGPDVLAGVDLRAREGHVTAIAGGRGAGKTTLIRVLVGELTAHHGDVAVHVPQDVAVVPEDPQRFELTVREFLSLGHGDVPEGAPGEQALWAALERAEARDFVEGLPDGLDAQLASRWGGVDLSDDRWQRLTLARLFLSNAPIWVLDEPTSSIDPEVEDILMRRLRELAEVRTVLLACRTARTLRYADAIYVLEGGQVVQCGSFDELSSSPGPFAGLLGKQNAGHPRSDGVPRK